MMLDTKGILLVLVLLALVGLACGAVAAIWPGPWAMLWGAVGLPGLVVALVLLWLAFTLGGYLCDKGRGK